MALPRPSGCPAFLGRSRITILDSMTTSWGLGLMVEAAAEAIAKDSPWTKSCGWCGGCATHLLSSFVERLDYLEQGGRIGAGTGLAGHDAAHQAPASGGRRRQSYPGKGTHSRMAIEKLADFVAEFASIQDLSLSAVHFRTTVGRSSGGSVGPVEGYRAQA